jgi:pimeloyl-ACP methyl ester carboxylesterase
MELAPSMSDHRLRHALTAPDGTRLAFHTHLGPHRKAAALAGLAPLLLTNGIGTSENFWRFLVARLAGDFRVVHWDYRGHGESETAATGDYRLEAHVADLERVTEAVMAASRGRTPHHVAFSMGVRVVLELYRRRPDLVASLTLLAGTPSPPGTGSLLLRLPGGAGALRRGLDALTPLVPAAAPLVHAFLASPLAWPAARLSGTVRPRAPRQDIDAMMAALRSMDPRAYWDTLRGLLQGDSRDVLPRVRVPTLVVAAREDILVPVREVRRMHAALPGAQYLEVADAGHAGLVEAGEDIAAAVHDFLNRQPPVRLVPGSGVEQERDERLH